MIHDKKRKKSNCRPRRVTREGAVGEVSPAFFKNCKKVFSYWDKVPWLWSSMGWISHLKANFDVSRGKDRRFFCYGAFLYRVADEFLSNCPNSKKTPCRKIFLVTRLRPTSALTNLLRSLKMYCVTKVPHFLKIFSKCQTGFREYLFVNDNIII